MSNGIWSAVSGAVGQLQAIDVTANNVANASVPGFQGDKVVFEQTLRRVTSRGTASQSMRSSNIQTIVTDFSQGPPIRTGRELDAAILGDGFFAVRTESGERYMRIGQLHVSADGELATRDGDPILDADREPIPIGIEHTSVGITADGSVMSGGKRLGQVMIVKFAKVNGMEREGTILFRAGPSAGEPQAVKPRLEPASLEGSNYSPVKGMIDLINITRTFDACQRAIEVFRDADRKAATSIASR